MDEPSEPVWDMFWWSAMSWLWFCAALVSLAFSVTGPQPAFSRSALTRASTRSVGPESTLLAEARGAAAARVAFGVLGGDVVFLGWSAVGVGVGVADFEGDALGLVREREGLGLPDGEAEVSAAEGVADTDGVRDGAGEAVSDLSPPHQEDATLRKPPSPTPLACATTGMPMAPTATTTAEAMAILRRFERFLLWRCLLIRGLTHKRHRPAQALAARHYGDGRAPRATNTRTNAE